MKLSFVCNADTRQGYGHLARCLTLARLCEGIATRPRIAFQGSFSDEAIQRIREVMPNASIRPETQCEACDVAVSDRLGAPDDLNCHPLGLIDQIFRHAARLIYIASGTEAPRLPKGALCIGYQPGGPAPAPPDLLWGFDYAPVDPTVFEPAQNPRDPGRALVAMGGANDDAALRLALAALAEVREIARVDLLLSPVTQPAPLQCAPHQVLRTYRNLPGIGPLLSGAGMVIASFGNLFYEALALGAPVCLLAQKGFQRDLAQRAASLGLAIDAGTAKGLGASRLASKIRETLAMTIPLAERGRAAVDGQGLARIARIIAEPAAVRRA